MFNFEFNFNFDIIYNIHLHITSAYSFSTLFIIYTFIAFVIITFIIFTVYVFVVQLYICQCNCHLYSISFSSFIVLYSIFCIQSLYLIFVIIIHEIFHYIHMMFIIWYSLLCSHLFVHDIFFILIFDYHSLDLLTLTELIKKFSTLHKTNIKLLSLLYKW